MVQINICSNNYKNIFRDFDVCKIIPTKEIIFNKNINLLDFAENENIEFTLNTETNNVYFDGECIGKLKS